MYLLTCFYMPTPANPILVTKANFDCYQQQLEANEKKSQQILLKCENLIENSQLMIEKSEDVNSKASEGIEATRMYIKEMRRFLADHF